MPLLVGVIDPVLQRICGEYLEMPDLRLTVKQATRFWGMDEQTCSRSLEYLVEMGFLARVGQDTYRLSHGTVKCPPLRMARASLGRRWPVVEGRFVGRMACHDQAA